MFVYKPDFIPQSIFLIGAGGTGSRLMPMLAQLVRTSLRKFNPAGWVEKIDLIVVDGDDVEEKNLLRQNFIQKDVGNKKAVVLANRYSNAFGINIFPHPLFLRPAMTGYVPLGRDTQVSYHNSIFILAVDSAQARRDILEHIMEIISHSSTGMPPKCFIIDAGNEDAFGQIKFFTLNPLVCRDTDEAVLKRLRAGFPKNSPLEFESNFIPYDPFYYDSLGSSAAELSCADLPQTLAINAMMATMICCVVQNFLQFRPMSYDGLRFAMNGSVSTDYNTAKRWLDRAVIMPTVVGRRNFRDRYFVSKLPLPLMNNPTKQGVSNVVLQLAGIDLGGDSFFESCRLKTEKALTKMGMKLDENRDMIPIYTPPPPLPTESIPALEPVTKKKPKSKSQVEAEFNDVIAEPVSRLSADGVPPLPQATPVRMEEMTAPQIPRAVIQTGQPVLPVYEIPLPAPRIETPRTNVRAG